MGTETLAYSCASADITPQEPVALGGYAHRRRPYQGIADRLEANVLVVANGVREIVIVTADLLFIGDYLRQEVLAGLGLQAAPESLFLSSSHTHFAPMTQFGQPKLGVPEPSYLRLAAAQIVDAVRQARETFAPATIDYFEGFTNHAMNRRLKRLRLTRRGLSYGSGMGPNPKGERDGRILALRITSPQGRTRAIVWTYACHPNGSPDPYMVSADFPGVVRSAVRSSYGPIPVLFLQGLSADLRPPFLGGAKDLGSLVRRICLGPLFGSPSLCEWEKWAGSLGKCVADILRASSRPINGSPLASARYVLPWPGVQWPSSRSKDMTLHAVRLGDIVLVGFSAEVATSYRLIVEKAFPECKPFSVSCTDQTWAYLPNNAMLSEGGYEVEGFRPAFDFGGRYRFNPEPAIEGALARLRAAVLG